MGIMLANIRNILKNAHWHPILIMNGLFMGGIMDWRTVFDKTDQLLACLVKGSDKASVTSLMKLAYIIDLVSMQETKEQISEFEYVRYTYGPFDPNIYPRIERLVQDDVLLGQMEFTSCNDGFIMYKYVSEDFKFSLLTTKEQELIDGVLTKLRGYGAAALTDLAYNTKPMLKLGAKQDNREGLNQKLDLQTE